MKKLLLLTFFSSFFFSTSAQEKFFHELTGMEDSSGVTHLFHRMYEDIDGDSSSEDLCVLWRDDIYAHQISKAGLKKALALLTNSLDHYFYILQFPLFLYF